MLQHAILKGLNCQHLRRLTYTSIFTQLRDTEEILLMFLDLSNGYGQTDRELVTKQVTQGGNLQWAWRQQSQLYAHITAYVVTAMGLSMAYSVTGGLVQGGGMDPYFYIWNSLFLAGPGIGEGGISLRLWESMARLHIQCVVDDTTLWGATTQGLQHSVNRTIVVLKAMNVACNPDKFGLIHYAYHNHKITPQASTIQVEGTTVHAAKRTKYIKFLGGNANVLTAAGEDIQGIRKHARHITAQACRHVPSLAILKALVAGCILARWLYKRSVGWPQHVNGRGHAGETKTVLGIMCNTMRRTLYLPLNTPKQFFVHAKGLAVTPPLQAFWENNLMDMYKTANAKHQWVRETTQMAIIRPWGGMGTLREVDTDYDKLYRWCTEHQWKPVIHHEGAQCDTWECHASVKSIPHRVLVVVGDVSGKQGEAIWGLGAVASDLHGTIVWEGQAWMDLMHGSTDVLEATEVVEACRAIHRATSARGESVALVLAFCDNKGAATALAHHTLTHRGGNLMDRTVCDFYDLAQSMPLRMGWCPAQHDTQLQGVLAMANKAADTKAKRAQKHREGSHWTMPQAWVARHTFAWYHKGRRVMGIKRMVRDSMRQAGDSVPLEQGYTPMEHVQERREDASLRHQWAQCTFRHPRDQASALLAAFFENTRDMYIDTEGHGECEACKGTYACRVTHAHQRCPNLWHSVVQGMGAIARVCREHTKRGVQIHQMWGGVQLTGHGTTVLLLWVPPKHSWWYEQSMHTEGITLWPMYTASVPSTDVVAAMQVLSVEPARHLCLRIMHTQGMYIWHTATADTELWKEYWALPAGRHYAAMMHTDDRCRYQEGEGQETTIPAPLLWALLAAVWGTNTRLAAKGVQNMRLCSIQHAAWGSHKRIGSLPLEGLQRVTAPPFGMGLCYIAITEGGVTPQQRQWYERAEAQCRVMRRVVWEGHGAYMVICLTGGAQATEWAHAGQQAIDRVQMT